MAGANGTQHLFQIIFGAFTTVLFEEYAIILNKPNRYE